MTSCQRRQLGKVKVLLRGSGKDLGGEGKISLCLGMSHELFSTRDSCFLCEKLFIFTSFHSKCKYPSAPQIIETSISIKNQELWLKSSIKTCVLHLSVYWQGISGPLTLVQTGPLSGYTAVPLQFREDPFSAWTWMTGTLGRWIFSTIQTQ